VSDPDIEEREWNVAREAALREEILRQELARQEAVREMVNRAEWRREYLRKQDRGYRPPSLPGWLRRLLRWILGGDI